MVSVDILNNQPTTAMMAILKSERLQMLTRQILNQSADNNLHT